MDFRLLFALVPPGAYFTDLLTPPPSSPLPDLDDELALAAAADRDEVVSEVARLPTADSPVVREFLADPDAGVAEAVAQLRLYWDTALAPFWSQLRGLLESEVR